MGSKRDYYEVLGVKREASPDEIRKAYRQAALKHHPDRNQDDPSAADKFKEATEAHQVLSDPDKRSRYDQFGHAGVEGSVDLGGDIFSHFQDIFSEFFGGFGGFGGRGGGRRRGPARGRDVRVQQRLTLREAMEGCKREVMLHTPVRCDSCSGSGAKAGSKPAPCRTCGGNGQVTVSRGFIMFSQTCGDCQGAGVKITDPCKDCAGAGFVEKARKVLVTFPAGVDAGQRLRVPGQGMPAPQAEGSQPGDLYVDVDIAADERFERDGYDLATRAKVSFAEAALGATVEVELPDTSTVDVAIPSGTQPGDVLTTKSKGIPRLDGRGRGALHVVVQVEVPRTLSKRAKQLTLELDEELAKARSKAKSA